MAIIKTKKTDNFTQVSNGFITDSNLSAKAKGILLYLLSKPHNWTVRISDITNHMKDGRDSITSGINELIQHGYIVRKQIRELDGTFSHVSYDVYESPVDTVQLSHNDKAATQSPQLSDNPMVSTNTENGKSTYGEADTTNTENNNTEKHSSSTPTQISPKIKQILSKFNLTNVNKATLQRWSQYSISKIEQAITYTMSRKQKVKSIIGYITACLQQGFSIPTNDTTSTTEAVTSNPEPSVSKHVYRKPKTDLPPWVAAQVGTGQIDCPKTDSEITPQQQAEVNRLMAALGEL